MIVSNEKLIDINQISFSHLMLINFNNNFTNFKIFFFYHTFLYYKNNKNDIIIKNSLLEAT